jgi:predicted permease
MPRDARNLRFLARLRDGVSFDAAAAEVAAIGDAIANEHPETNRGWRVRMIPIRDLIGGQDFWVVIALFMLSVAFLIAIATANVSNLVMVRAISRQRELAVRTALGARRGRLVRQMVVEGIALSIVAGALSLPFTYAALQAIVAASPEPVFRQLKIDAHELAFIASLALICPMLFSIAPARTLARSDTRQILAAGGGRGTTAAGRGRGALVVAQVALAVTLLTASGLTVRAILGFYTQPTGMQTRDLLIFTLDFDDVQYATSSQARAAAIATREATQALPAVQHVAMLSALPIIGSESTLSLMIDGASASPADVLPTVVATWATEQTGQTPGFTVLAGRWWNDGDATAAVVSRETAVRYLGGVDRAVGQRITLPTASGLPALEVVGVVNDVISGEGTEVRRPRIWLPLDDNTRRLSFIVSTHGDPSAVASSIRSVVATTAPAVPLEGLQTMDDALRKAASSDYVIIGMLAGFATLALVLAATGLFGVVSYAATQRTVEFGTRMALGASTFDVIRLVARQSLTLLLVGLSIGLAGGIGVGFGMKSALFGLSPLDPITIAGVAGLLLVVTLVATAIPAWRAGRIDPIAALRSE